MNIPDVSVLLSHKYLINMSGFSFEFCGICK